MHLHFALLDAAFEEGEAAGVVVGRNYHEGVAVLFGPFENGADYFVKVEEFLAHVADFVAVGPVVYLRTLDHEEKSLLVIQHIDCLHGAFHEDGTAVEGGLEVVFVVKAKEAVAFSIFNVLKLIDVGVAFGLHLFDEVAAV